jgi:hypothetical protein
VQRDLHGLRVGGQPAADDPHLVDLARRHVSAELPAPAGAPERLVRAPPERLELGQRPPVDEPARHQPEDVEAAVRRVGGEHHPGPRVCRLKHAAEAAEHELEPPRAASQPCRPLIPELARRRPHLRRDVGEQLLAAVGAAHEQPQRRVQPGAIEVRV